MDDTVQLPMIAVDDPIDSKLSAPQEIVTAITYETPNILLSASMAGGIITKSVREARPIQVPLTTRIEWGETPLDEREKVFAIHARNRINFAGVILDVINDAIEFGETNLPATSPTAEEYLSLVGNPVLIHFSCERDRMESDRLGKPVYKIVRNSIVLP